MPVQTVPPTNFDNLYRRPIITLAGAGDQITLDGVGTGWTLKPGSTGLGVPKMQYDSAALAGGGEVLRHHREEAREIFLPIDVHFGTGADEYADLEEARRRIEAICAGEVQIVVDTLLGRRIATGWLTDGLMGDFQTSAVNLVRMNLGLAFKCFDPLFYGAEQSRSWVVSESKKPFITSPEKPVPFFPVILSSSSIDGETAVTVGGDMATEAVVTVAGPGKDLLVENRTTGDKVFMIGDFQDTVTIDARPHVLDIYTQTKRDGSLWDMVTTDSSTDLITLAPGENRIAVSMVGATPKSEVRVSWQEKYRAAH